MVALELTVAQINTILNALGQLPYSTVYQLIETIHQQVAPQLDEPEQAAGTTG